MTKKAENIRLFVFSFMRKPELSKLDFLLIL